MNCSMNLIKLYGQILANNLLMLQKIIIKRTYITKKIFKKSKILEGI